MKSVPKNETSEINPPDRTNRVFLTSRLIETIEARKSNEPVFEVAPLDMEQLRESARTFYGADSQFYREFDEVIWRQEVVKKIAGTPLTALLLMIYYENFRRIDRRYLMYDLLLKFFILRVWDEWIKESRFRRDLRYFFEEAKGNLMQRYPEAATQYDCLSLLAYECLYESRTGTPLRDIHINTIKQHFASWLEKNNKTHMNRIPEEVNRWIDGLVEIQLFIPSGFEEYTLMHSTIMEFLAARWILKEIDEIDIDNIANKDIEHRLETLPIACGGDLEKGYTLISFIKLKPYKLDHQLASLLYRCLCETEQIEAQELEGLRTQRRYEERQKEIKEKQRKIEWIYHHLARILMPDRREELEEATKYYDGISKLTRPTLLEYMQEDKFFESPSEIRVLQTALLDKLMHKEELIELWKKEWYQTKWGIPGPLLNLDSKEYHPEDKNFKYYQDRIGKALTGFLGSPNLKHDAGVNSCAFSPDGNIILSASGDYTLRLWDIKTGKELYRLELLWIPCDISINPKDPKIFATANSNSTITLFCLEMLETGSNSSV